MIPPHFLTLLIEQTKGTIASSLQGCGSDESPEEVLAAYREVENIAAHFEDAEWAREIVELHGDSDVALLEWLLSQREEEIARPERQN